MTHRIQGPSNVYVTTVQAIGPTVNSIYLANFMAYNLSLSCCKLHDHPAHAAPAETKHFDK